MKNQAFREVLTEIKLRNEIAEMTRELERKRARRAEIAARKVHNEARRKRFLNRMDGEIGMLVRDVAMAEANLEGLVSPVG